MSPRQHHDMAVTNGRLVTPIGIISGTVVVRRGEIADICGADDVVHAANLIDAGGRYVLPGLIDSHVHFRTPGLTHKEDWRHGGRAAAAGGVTCVMDMPNTDPPLLDVDGIEERAALVAGESLVDFGFHLGVSEQSASVLSAVRATDAATIKVFMTGHHTAPHVIRDARVLESVFEHAADRGLRVLLHAEDDAVFSILDRGRAATGAAAWEALRSRAGGIVAVARVIELVSRHGTAAHVLHVSSAEEADLLTAARSTGLPISFEVTPHHLTFTDDDVRRSGSWLKLSPAIRRDDDRERLWQAVISGHALTIGSDHAPHTRDEKSLPDPDAPPGLPGVQEMLAAVNTGLTHRLPDEPDERMRIIARTLAAGPAHLCGIAHRKGELRIGADADLVIFDPDVRWTPSEADVQSRCGWSGYSDATLTGRACVTVRRGEVIWDVQSGRFGAANGAFIRAGVREDVVAGV